MGIKCVRCTSIAYQHTQTTIPRTIIRLHLEFLGALDLYISNMLSHTILAHTYLPSLKFKCSLVPKVRLRDVFLRLCVCVCVLKCIPYIEFQYATEIYQHNRFSNSYAKMNEKKIGSKSIEQKESIVCALHRNFKCFVSIVPEHLFTLTGDML